MSDWFHPRASVKRFKRDCLFVIGISYHKNIQSQPLDNSENHDILELHRACSDAAKEKCQDLNSLTFYKSMIYCVLKIRDWYRTTPKVRSGEKKPSVGDRTLHLLRYKVHQNKAPPISFHRPRLPPLTFYHKPVNCQAPKTAYLSTLWTSLDMGCLTKALFVI